MTEKELQQRIFNYLSHYFYVESEVWSVCRTRRIDLAMFHKSDIAHAYPIGIEIKTFSKKTGGDIGRWLKQAQTYSELQWSGFGKMLILVAPQISGYVFEEGELTDANHHEDDRPTAHHNVSTFIGQFGIGEMQSYTRTNYTTQEKKKYYRFVLKGQILWVEHYDTLYTDHYTKLCGQ